MFANLYQKQKLLKKKSENEKQICWKYQQFLMFQTINAAKHIGGWMWLSLEIMV